MIFSHFVSLKLTLWDKILKKHTKLLQTLSDLMLRPYGGKSQLWFTAPSTHQYPWPPPKNEFKIITHTRAHRCSSSFCLAVSISRLWNLFCRRACPDCLRRLARVNLYLNLNAKTESKFQAFRIELNFKRRQLNGRILAKQSYFPKGICRLLTVLVYTILMAD